MAQAVEFHTGVLDPVALANRMLRKAYRQGQRVRLTAPPDTLRELDRLLWAEDEHDFVPHALVPQMTATMATLTPLWLAADAQVQPAGAVQGAAADGAPTVLINLGAAAPLDVHRWQRVIEVVGADPDEAARGRERWAHYKREGRDLQHLPAVRAHG
jgi:DNA polymerase III subunit chi